MVGDVSYCHWRANCVCLNLQASISKTCGGEEGKLGDETIGGPSLGQYFDLLSKCFDLTPKKECQAC
jgi:hypothetical protein